MSCKNKTTLSVNRQHRRKTEDKIAKRRLIQWQCWTLLYHTCNAQKKCLLFMFNLLVSIYVPLEKEFQSWRISITTSKRVTSIVRYSKTYILFYLNIRQDIDKWCHRNRDKSRYSDKVDWNIRYIFVHSLYLKIRINVSITYNNNI